jgi:hypothetical protein
VTTRPGPVNAGVKNETPQTRLEYGTPVRTALPRSLLTTTLCSDVHCRNSSNVLLGACSPTVACEGRRVAVFLLRRRYVATSANQGPKNFFGKNATRGYAPGTPPSVRRWDRGVVDEPLLRVVDPHRLGQREHAAELDELADFSVSCSQASRAGPFRTGHANRAQSATVERLAGGCGR